MRERFVRHGDAIRMEKLDATPRPDDSVAVPLEAKAGSLVCFHGLLPHSSAPTRSPVSRHAYTLHATDGNAGYTSQNRIQRSAAFPPAVPPDLPRGSVPTFGHGLGAGASGRRALLANAKDEAVSECRH